jgi:hypothetical protein
VRVNHALGLAIFTLVWLRLRESASPFFGVQLPALIGENLALMGLLVRLTSAASVPLALDCAIRDGRLKPGQLLLLKRSAAGLPGTPRSCGFDAAGGSLDE